MRFSALSLANIGSDGATVGRALLHRGSYVLEELEDEIAASNSRNRNCSSERDRGRGRSPLRCRVQAQCQQSDNTVLPGRKKSLRFPAQLHGGTTSIVPPLRSTRSRSQPPPFILGVGGRVGENNDNITNGDDEEYFMRISRRGQTHRSQKEQRLGGKEIISTFQSSKESSTLKTTLVQYQKCGGLSSSFPAEQHGVAFSNGDYMYPSRRACAISLDLCRPPPSATSAEAVRHHQDLGRKAQSLLAAAYERDVDRNDPSRYVVLPTAAGLAIVVFRPATGHPSREYTALWFGARMIAWARQSKGPQCLLRGGLASGTFETVQDVYGLPVVIGPSMGTAMKIMDCSRPGQILACSDSVVPELEFEIDVRAKAHGSQDRTYAMSYEVNNERHEVIANDNTTAVVQAITGAITKTGIDGDKYDKNEEGKNVLLTFGTTDEPVNKWYLRLKPTELQYDEAMGAKAKVPPAELLLRHKRVAFVGVTHGQILNTFKKVIDKDPSKTWDRIYFLFLSDDKLNWIAESDSRHNKPVDDLIEEKRSALRSLQRFLTGRVKDLGFLEYDHPFYCASYWDWDERGGFIHISPLVWGLDPRTCPSMNHHWIGMDAGDNYVAYQDGLISLLQTSKRLQLECEEETVGKAGDEEN